MALKCVVVLNVPLDSFKDFDGGKEVELTVPSRWDLQAGNSLEWQCGSQHGGIATVVSSEIVEEGGVKCVFRNIF